MSGPERAPRRRTSSLNVRGSLVEERDAERLRIAEDRRAALATMSLGGLMLVMAVAVVVTALGLDNGGTLIGPATAPWLIGVLLFVSGGLMVRRGRLDMGVWEYSDHLDRQDWLRAASLLAILVVYALLMPVLGYVLATTLLFASTAVVLGSRSRVSPVVHGWIVSVLVFLAFDVGIGISLPTGPWGF